MMFLRLILCAVAATCLMPTAWAQAPNCIQRERLLRHLAAKYAERPIAVGLSANGSVFELLKSTSGESWTLVMTNTDGKSCLIAYGKHWEFLPRRDPHVGFGR